jgi:DNA polymerase theta
MYSGKGAEISAESTGVVVCTIEKANALVLRLLEGEDISLLSCLIVDELHMVGDDQRGYLLELLLTKLRYSTAALSQVRALAACSRSRSASWHAPDCCCCCCAQEGEGLQIVGMSATVANAAAFAQWLDARLYQTDFRPVPLRKLVKVGRELRDARGALVRTLPAGGEADDPDHTALLCRETLDAGKSLLLFCGTKAVRLLLHLTGLQLSLQAGSC